MDKQLFIAGSCGTVGLNSGRIVCHEKGVVIRHLTWVGYNVIARTTRRVMRPIQSWRLDEQRVERYPINDLNLVELHIRHDNDVGPVGRATEGTGLVESLCPS